MVLFNLFLNYELNCIHLYKFYKILYDGTITNTPFGIFYIISIIELNVNLYIYFQFYCKYWYEYLKDCFPFPVNIRSISWFGDITCVLVNLIGNGIPSSFYHVSNGDNVPEVNIIFLGPIFIIYFIVKNGTKQIKSTYQFLSTFFTINLKWFTYLFIQLKHPGSYKTNPIHFLTKEATFYKFWKIPSGV